MNHHGVIIYHSFNDPIFKGLMLTYLKAFQLQDGERSHTFHLITFEQEQYRVSKSEQLAIDVELKKIRIVWYPQQYHTGGAFLILKKLWDFFLCFKSSLRIHKVNKLKSLIGFTSLSGGLALVLSGLLRVKFIALNIEPHSDFMVDAGQWKKQGLKYKLLKFLENRIMIKADHVAVPSKSGFSFWNDKKRSGRLYFVPTCIDINDFSIGKNSKTVARAELGLPTAKRIVLYLGKFGGIYYSPNEAANIFKKLLASNNDLFFYVITPGNLEEVKNSFEDYGLKDQYLIRDKIPYEQLSRHIALSDFGIVLIPPYPSQRYRCPIKTANYLACGIPYIVPPDIGDDSFLAVEEQVGVVITESNMTISMVPRSGEYYRSIAEKYRGINISVDFFKTVLSKI